MRLVRCIENEEYDRLVVGNKYFVDDDRLMFDAEDNVYVATYTTENKDMCLGHILVSKFKTIDRYLKYGHSLMMYINTDTEFLLKDIINWCLNKLDSPASEYIIKYINDNNLLLKENMEKSFIVKHTPYLEFAENEKHDDYMKYLGYTLECID